MNAAQTWLVVTVFRIPRNDHGVCWASIALVRAKRFHNFLGTFAGGRGMARNYPQKSIWHWWHERSYPSLGLHICYRGLSDPRIAELSERPRRFSIKLQSETHRVDTSRRIYSWVCLRANPLDMPRTPYQARNTLNNPPCPITPPSCHLLYIIHFLSTALQSITKPLESPLRPKSDVKHYVNRSKFLKMYIRLS